MTDTKELCQKIAQEISGAFFYAGEYSGFSANGKKEIAAALENLVNEIKRELLEEFRRTP